VGGASASYSRGYSHARRCWFDRFSRRRIARCRVFSRPGKPTDNAFIESFNGKFRQECLNQHWFLSLEEAQGLIEVWREDYNQHRPHSALGDRTLVEFANFSRGACPLENLVSLAFRVDQTWGQGHKPKF